MEKNELFILIGSFEEKAGTILIFWHREGDGSSKDDIMPQLYNCLIHHGIIMDPSTICIIWTIHLYQRLFLMPTKNTNENHVTIVSHNERNSGYGFSQ